MTELLKHKAYSNAKFQEIFETLKSLVQGSDEDEGT